MLRRTHSSNARISSRLLDRGEPLETRRPSLGLRRTYLPYPPVNVKEQEEHFDLEIIVPGFKKENLDVFVEGDELFIKGEMTIDQESEDDQYLRKEHIVESFERAFELNASIDRKRIEAKYEDGMLTIRLYRNPEALEVSDPVNIAIE